MDAPLSQSFAGTVAAMAAAGDGEPRILVAEDADDLGTGGAMADNRCYSQCFKEYPSDTVSLKAAAQEFKEKLMNEGIMCNIEEEDAAGGVSVFQGGATPRWGIQLATDDSSACPSTASGASAGCGRAWDPQDFQVAVCEQESMQERSRAQATYDADICVRSGPQWRSWDRSGLLDQNSAVRVQEPDAAAGRPQQKLATVPEGSDLGESCHTLLGTFGPQELPALSGREEDELSVPRWGISVCARPHGDRGHAWVPAWATAAHPPWATIGDSLLEEGGRISECQEDPISPTRSRSQSPLSTVVPPALPEQIPAVAYDSSAAITTASSPPPEAESSEHACRPPTLLAQSDSAAGSGTPPQPSSYRQAECLVALPATAPATEQEREGPQQLPLHTQAEGPTALPASAPAAEQERARSPAIRPAGRVNLEGSGSAKSVLSTAPLVRPAANLRPVASDKQLPLRTAPEGSLSSRPSTEAEQGGASQKSSMERDPMGPSQGSFDTATLIRHGTKSPLAPVLFSPQPAQQLASQPAPPLAQQPTPQPAQQVAPQPAPAPQPAQQDGAGNLQDEAVLEAPNMPASPGAQSVAGAVNEATAVADVGLRTLPRAEACATPVGSGCTTPVAGSGNSVSGLTALIAGRPPKVQAPPACQLNSPSPGGPCSRIHVPRVLSQPALIQDQPRHADAGRRLVPPCPGMTPAAPVGQVQHRLEDPPTDPTQLQQSATRVQILLTGSQTPHARPLMRRDMRGAPTGNAPTIIPSGQEPLDMRQALPIAGNPGCVRVVGSSVEAEPVDPACGPQASNGSLETGATLRDSSLPSPICSQSGSVNVPGYAWQEAKAPNSNAGSCTLPPCASAATVASATAAQLRRHTLGPNARSFIQSVGASVGSGNFAAPGTQRPVSFQQGRPAQPQQQQFAPAVVSMSGGSASLQPRTFSRHAELGGGFAANPLQAVPPGERSSGPSDDAAGDAYPFTPSQASAPPHAAAPATAAPAPLGYCRGAPVQPQAGVVAYTPSVPIPGAPGVGMRPGRHFVQGASHLSPLQQHPAVMHQQAMPVGSIAMNPYGVSGARG